MSNVNNQFKELINEAIHNYFHDKTETEMILKDWLYGICEQVDEYEAKAKAFDDYHSIISKHIEQQHSHNKHDMVKRFVKIHDEYESGDHNV